MLRRLLILAALLTAAPAAAQTGSYRALGTEPFWSVTIGDGRIVYERAGEARISIAAPRAQRTRYGRTYWTRRLGVTVITGRECSDGMSDRRYADTVIVRVGIERLNGCGGAIMAPEALDGTAWDIVRIGSDRVSGPRYRMSFEGGRLQAGAGCNSIGGAYRVRGDRLIPNDVLATEMACGPPARDHERLVLRLLQGPIRFRHPDGQTLELSGAAGTALLRRQAP